MRQKRPRPLHFAIRLPGRLALDARRIIAYHAIPSPTNLNAAAMPQKRKRKTTPPLAAGAQLKQARESVAIGKIAKELEARGLICGDESVWGDSECTALAELVPERSHVVLKKIWATECNRGHASRLLTQICEAADAAEIKLRLETRPFKLSLFSRWKKREVPPTDKTRKNVEDWLAHFRYLPTPPGRRRGGLDRRALRGWYEKFGFVQSGRTNIMVREPQPGGREPETGNIG